MEESKIIVYALLDEQDRVVDINSSVFLPDVGGWARIDEGAGDRYTHAYNHYLPGRPLDVDGVPLYKWDGAQVLPRTQEEIEADRAALPVPEPVLTAEDVLNALLGVTS